MPTDPVLKWLLEGDAAIRWQALRDLKEAAERTVLREQRRIRPTHQNLQSMGPDSGDEQGWPPAPDNHGLDQGTVRARQIEAERFRWRPHQLRVSARV